MKSIIFVAALVSSATALTIPPRHTLNELCFHVSARTSPWSVDAEEIPLGGDFTDGDFCFDNRFKTLRNDKGQACSMEYPDYRFECHDNLNATTKFEISYPAADGPPYLTYDNAPGIFYACPADTDPEYNFHVFSAKAPFGSVCLPITLTLEPTEVSSDCTNSNGTAAGVASITTTTWVTTITVPYSSTAATSSTQLSTTSTSTGINNSSAVTTTNSIMPTSGPYSNDTVTLFPTDSNARPEQTDTDSDTEDADITSALGRPIISATSSAAAPTSTGWNATLAPSAPFATNMTAITPLVNVPAATAAAVTTDYSMLPQSCSVPTSAPSVGPWRVGSPKVGPGLGNYSEEAAITDKNSTVFEYVIPENFGLPTASGVDGGDDTTQALAGNGLCALQFRMPFCSDLPAGYPCYGFTGTTQEVRANSGALFDLMHNGEKITWDNKALQQFFPGRSSILGTFPCADIGGGEMGDRTMSWVATSVQGFGLEFLQADIGDDAEFKDGIGAWVVACQ